MHAVGCVCMALCMASFARVFLITPTYFLHPLYTVLAGARLSHILQLFRFLPNKALSKCDKKVFVCASLSYACILIVRAF